MGAISSLLRLTYLTNYRLDLEYKMQLITTAKLNLSAGINELVSVGTDLDPDSPEVKALEKKKERLYLVEKRLEERRLRYETQLKMVEGEMESVRSQLDKNIQMSYGGG